MNAPSPPSFFELARQALSKTQRGYDLLAPKFEATPYATPLPWIEACLIRVNDKYPVPEPATARGGDLCCGTGRAARLLRASCPGGVEGYDFSQPMLEEAARLSASLNKMSWHQLDFSQQSLPSRQFQRLTCFGAWGHILPSFRMSFLRQVCQSLAPGGTFFTLTTEASEFWERRFWLERGFDLGIRLRNTLWFGEFHMYYRLNETGPLFADFERVIAQQQGEYEIELEPLPRYPNRVLSLMTVHRRQSG